MIKANLLGFDVLLMPRDSDRWGSGKYGASRGDRLHEGIDYMCPDLAGIYSPVVGEVTKIGWVSSKPEKKHFRYVEVQDPLGNRHRVMYILPTVIKGQIVDRDTLIGFHQTLLDIYPSILDHVHYEIQNFDRTNYLNPSTYKR
jgi:murein DD-endopeptidase MepM/ murein hydrolase activator NlpD